MLLSKHYVKCNLSFDNWLELQMTHWNRNSWTTCHVNLWCVVRENRKSLLNLLFFIQITFKSLPCFGQKKVLWNVLHFTVGSDADWNAGVWYFIALYTTLKSSGSWQTDHLTSISGGSKGGEGRAPPPAGPNFFHFHAVFGKNWPNNRLAPPFGVSAPSSGKSWIRHCLCCATLTFLLLVARRATYVVDGRFFGHFFWKVEGTVCTHVNSHVAHVWLLYTVINMWGGELRTSENLKSSENFNF